MSHDRELTLHDYERLFYRRKNIFFFIVLGTVLCAGFFNEVMPPEYEAAAVVDVGAAPGTRSVNQDRQAWFEAEVKALQSAAVLKQTAERMGWIKSGAAEIELRPFVEKLRRVMKVEPTAKMSNYVRLSALARTPREAGEIVDSVVLAYIGDRKLKMAEAVKAAGADLAAGEERLHRAEENLRSYTEKSWMVGTRPYLVNRLVVLRSEEETLSKLYTGRHPKVEKIKREITQTEKLLAQLPQQELGYQRLLSETQARQADRDGLAKRRGDAVRAEAVEATAVFVDQQTEVSKDPVSPRKLLNLTIAVFLGLMLGIAAVLIMESMDVSLSTVEDIEKYLTLPVLAVVMHIASPDQETAQKSGASWKKLFKRKNFVEEAREKLAFYHPPKSAFMEPYHALMANLKPLRGPDSRPGAVIIFTSAARAEGKTLTSINSAFIAAQSGLKTLFVDGDIRCPMVHKLLSVPFKSGLADCLTGGCRLEDAVISLSHLIKNAGIAPLYRDVPRGIENLCFLSSGVSSSNPADILTSEHIRTFLKEARIHYDLVVMDTPPLLPCADALLLGPHTDGVIMVLKAGYASELMVKRAKDQLVQSGAKILGVILNDVRARMMEPDYAQSYYYQYSAPDTAGEKSSGTGAGRQKIPHRILIVDDEALVRKLLNRIVKETFPDADIYEAEDGVDAVHKIADLSPALVILDICLPMVNGLQVCNIARRGGRFGGAKILAVTGIDTAETSIKATEVGADDFLGKPFEIREVKEKLIKLLPPAG
ncbi:MAG: hypothetical protein A2X28_06245 [Elusimicrobia bacterium GWA2_56_46]|nr:MAG: hypothetical protein A2X28_06245 [Elusimicrobia bacterium GWA2_56_46]OGR54630.1 MAG: hypothetical protein A2X39_02295 [Elusimicrobia bacterium GWC2_56_31]HBB66051.1 hypothetical protein [Elusimicrobiota bacterium]HBW23886.1 hypothetical protein [Elusimicrobiota bacterium]